MRKFIVPVLVLGSCATPAVPPPPAPPPSGGVVAAAAPAATNGYPPTEHRDVKETLHGVEVVDPFQWLEDEKAPDVKAWMKAQDGYTRGRLHALPGRDVLAARFKELLYLDAVSAPFRRGQRYFYTRRHATKEKTVVYWKQGKQGAEKVLFDPNTWSTDGSITLRGWQPSWDGKTVAYQVSHNNSDEATMYVMDVATGKKSEVDTIEGAKYASASWTPKGDGFYYTWLPVDPKIPASERPGYAEVRFHKLGTDPKTDQVIHERTGDATTFIGADISRDGHWLTLSIAHGWNSNDVYFRDMRKKGNTEWTPFAVGRNAQFGVWPWKDRFYVHNNENAPRWKIDVVDPTHPKEWKPLIAQSDSQVLESMGIIGGRLALTWLKDVVSRLEIRNLDGSAPREIALPTLGSVGGPVGREDDDEAFYSFTSFTYPREIYSLSARTGKTSLFFRLKVPVDPTPYETEQVFFKSKDGTRVPMFIVRRKDLKKDGSAPTLLTGYGGFQSAMTPGFTASIFPWLERGGVYAVANLRGGSEYGESWHQDGMLLKKQNVFDDFIAAAEYLVSEKYTRPERLAIEGGSNGGLLVGAAMTQRPDLFRVVVCAVPLLDMLRYHRFGSGKTWVSEYGSAENAQQFSALYAYSPYHHVKKGTRYPSVLMMSADSDDRVDPMHARKFTASLQQATAGGPVLLRIETMAGHGGADLIKAWVDRLADQYAFIAAEMNLDPSLSTR
jgi:prolyl oligopeptidase